MAGDSLLTSGQIRKHREIDDFWHSILFFFFIQSRTPARGMVPATFRVSLPLSEASLGAPSQTCPEVCFLGESESWTVDNHRGASPPPLPSLSRKD